MSYTVTVVVPPVPSKDAEAWDSVKELADLKGARPQVLQALHDRLVARFPCISTLRDDQVDDGVWADGPLIDDFGHRTAVLGVSTRLNEVLPFVVKTATDLDLVVFDPQEGKIHRPGARGGTFHLSKPLGSMKKADVTRLLREGLDPTMKELGFRWTRGMYVRKWHGGHDCLGWGLADHAPVYNVGGFATLRIDALEELIAPHIPYSKPERAEQAFSINVNWLTAFEDGPETLRRDEESVETEDQVRARAAGLAMLVRKRVDPFWRSVRNPADLWRLPAAWRRFWPGPRQLHEMALAFLCAPASEQRRIEAEALAAFAPGDMHHRWIQSLVADLRARRGEG